MGGKCEGLCTESHTYNQNTTLASATPTLFQPTANLRPACHFVHLMACLIDRRHLATDWLPCSSRASSQRPSAPSSLCAASQTLASHLTYPISPPTDCRDQPHPELHIARLMADECYGAGLFVISLSAKFKKIAGIPLLQTSVASAMRIAQRII